MRLPLGYRTARRVIELGRAAFFGIGDADLPKNRSAQLQADDRTPQFGFVGSRYSPARILLFGINPGNGSETEMRSASDARMMPALARFAADPSPEHFVAAQRAYQAECTGWRTWRHCARILEAVGLEIEQIAYSNCLPWRSDHETRFSRDIATRAATLYAIPLVEELKPRLIVAISKRAERILSLGGRPTSNVVIWNAAHALTDRVREERDQAIAAIQSHLARPWQSPIINGASPTESVRPRRDTR